MNLNRLINSRLRKIIFPRAIVLIFSILLPVNITYANLLIMPKRIILEDKERSSSIILVNTSNLKMTFNVKWVQKRQMSNGRFMDLPPDNKEVARASAFLRFSPHKITLAPNEKQTVRIIKKGKIKIDSGELRSHLIFQSISDIDKNDYPFNVGPPIQSRLLRSYSIPVIIRKGKLDASAKITSIVLRKAVLDMGKISYNARLTLNGTGKNTAIGTLKILWKNKKKGDYRIVGNLSNVTLYPESASVHFKTRLNINNPSNGYMKVIYEGTNEFKGKTFGELEIPVQQNDFKFENIK